MTILESFLEHVSLATSIDNDWDGEKVNLMTMHASKGLEFDVFFFQVGKKVYFHIKNQLMKKGNRVLKRKEDLHMLELLELNMKFIYHFHLIDFIKEIG